MKKFASALTLVASGLISIQAHAAIDWTLTTGSNTSPSPVYGNARVYPSGALPDGSTIGVTATAFSSTGGTNTASASNASRNSHTIETAYLSIYTPSNGLGVVNRDGSSSAAVAVNSATGSDNNEFINNGSEHSMDNHGRSDAILLTFTDQIALQSLKLGWIGTDSDVFVLAWAGGGVPAALVGSSFSSVALDTVNQPETGWRLIDNLSNVALNTSTVLNAGAISSSYWLIGTGGFSSAGVTSGDKDANGNWISFGSSGAKYDYVKLAGVGGTKPGNGGVPPSSVAEPGSLVLAGLGLVGLIGLGRRRLRE